MIASLRAIFTVTIAGGVLAPALAFGHSSEFILAKVTPRYGRVLLELTADYGGNPMFANEAEARAVLGKVLRVQVDGTQSELAALAPLRFEERTQIDPTAPIPLDPATGTEPHHLLCALWSWRCVADKVEFEMPQDAGQSMILWTPAESPNKKPRWVFLLPGDVSPVITVPHRPLITCLIAGGVFGLSFMVVNLVRVLLGKEWRRFA